MNRHKFDQLKKLLQGIRVVRPPKYRLATFGYSKIQYSLITQVPGFLDRSRVRRGEVTAEKPQILTPQSMKEKFFGFGSDSDDYFELLQKQYGEALRGLEYQFHNELVENRVELTPPDNLITDLSKEFDSSSTPRTAIIKGSEKYWELSIMKFIVEETMASFASNVKELNERGYFDLENREMSRQHREVENLLKKARFDSNLIPQLGKKLKEYGLFDQYQDQFFQLLK